MVLLGVEKIYMFDIYANPQVQKLYEYYTDKGILEVTPLMLPQVQLNEPFIQHMFLEHDANMQAEVIPYNHCFLSHMYEYEYIGVMDTDEVIVPKGGMTSLRDLVNTAQKRATSENLSPGSFIARNCYFFDNATINNMKPHFPKDVYEDIHRNIDDLDIPAYMHMSQRLFKSKNCTGPGMYIKSLHSTEAVVAVHNHYHFKVLDPKYINYDLNFDEGFMHHYRNGCPGEMKPVCYSDYQSDFEYDDSILQYYDRLKENVIRVLDDLGYF
ncbi:uncharacterized protein [Atheta coriaria]|uniref:uncharacterized protein n=1 Tax=Dalotia coriaria TaxID=877792 RepID=UPI0031F35E87